MSMDRLLHNPIADLPGPEFLALYGVVIVGTLVICKTKSRQADSSRTLSPPLVPAKLDPYEIAFLRGGENEVLRLAILSLIQRGYLRVTETAKSWFRAAEQHIEPNPNHSDPRHLSELEGEIFRWLSKPTKAQDIFQSDDLATHLRVHCRSYEGRLRDENLLTSEAMRSSVWSVGLLGTLVIASLGGYKLLVALSKDHTNVLFLIVMGVISIISLIWMCQSPRLTSRGRAYLERIQLALERLKDRAASVSSASADPSLLLLAAVFGIGVLAGTPYAYYPRMFQRAAASSDGSVSTWMSSCGVSSCGTNSAGSSCGSSSCGGGGGCGGGCGGCGS